MLFPKEHPFPRMLSSSVGVLPLGLPEDLLDAVGGLVQRVSVFALSLQQLEPSLGGAMVPLAERCLGTLHVRDVPRVTGYRGEFRGNCEVFWKTNHAQLKRRYKIRFVVFKIQDLNIDLS